MYDPSDLSQDTIQDLFYQQIKRLTAKANGLESFDIQFSDQWI